MIGLQPGEAASPVRTTVTYPSGLLTEDSGVVLPDPRPPAPAGGVLLFTAGTPFHPVDPQWPDQPDDFGGVDLAGARWRVSRALMAATLPGSQVRR